MRFNCYRSGTIVAYVYDDGGVDLRRRQDGLSLLRTHDGIPRSVVDRADVATVAAILGCIAEDLDRHACALRGVEVNL